MNARDVRERREFAKDLAVLESEGMAALAWDYHELREAAETFLRVCTACLMPHEEEAMDRLKAVLAKQQLPGDCSEVKP